MIDNRDKKIFALLEEAVGLTGLKQKRFVTHACEGDSGMLERMWALLAVDGQDGDVLETPAHTLIANLGEFFNRLGEGLLQLSVGPYQVLRKLGEGGMGIVYHVRQNEPIVRDLALKMIKKEHTAPEILARFQAEQQALGQMNHPNVARVFHCDIHEGRPYYTMEYFPGQPISEFCRKNRLGLNDRLELFIQVCAGVSHAHGRGFIHRDLKPANILAWFQEGQAYVKVIDFGIAKLLGGSLLPKGFLETGFGQVVGTPLYMAPEQANRDGQLNLQCDIYALGCVLYEILTDTLPLDPERLKSVPSHRVADFLRTYPLEIPSLRLKKSQDSPFKPQRLRGDLDLIVTKAMSKKRWDRYDSAADLSRDLQHFLHHLPISARSAGFTYVGGKFFNRHRQGAGLAITLLVLAILGGIIIGRERQEKRLLEKAAQNFELQALHLEQLIEGMLDPDQLRGSPIFALTDRLGENIESLIDRFAASLKQKTMAPLVKVKIHGHLYRAYAEIGQFHKAKEHLESMLTIYELVGGTDRRRYLETLSRYAFIIFRLGDFENAEQHYRRCLDLIPADLKPFDPMVLDIRIGLANVKRRLGFLDQAILAYEQILEIQRQHLAENDPQLLETERLLGMALQADGSLDAAQELFDKVWLTNDSQFGPDHPATINALESLAGVIGEQGNDQRAESLFRESWERRKQHNGPEHPNSLRSAGLLANVLMRRQKYGEALGLLERVSKAEDDPWSEEHPDRLLSHSNYALALMKTGEVDRAIDVLQETNERLKSAYNYSHDFRIQVANQLADALKEGGRLDQAETLARQTLAVYLRKVEHKTTTRGQELKATLCEILMKAGKVEEALPYLRELEKRAPEIFPEHHPYPHFFRGLLGRCLWQLGRWDEATPYLEGSYQELPSGWQGFRAQLLDDLIAINKEHHPEKTELWQQKKRTLGD